jgi:hypothetical protein
MRKLSAFEDVAAFTEHPVTVVTDKLPSVAYAVHTSDNYFSVLGLTAERGRFFQAGDEARTTAVIGHSYWKTAFNSDPAIIGRRVTIDGVPFTIVAVAPRNFYGTRLFTYEPTFWLPVDPTTGQSRRGLSNVIGRLRSGVTVEQAQQELDRSSASFTVLSNASPINPWLASRDRIEMIGRLLILGVCMVLFVACADVANLLLVRMTVRRQEITTRIALGVSAGRLARQLLTESVIIVLLGALAAPPLAFLALKASSRLTPPLDFGISFHPSFDKRVIIFTAVTSVVTAIVFGLAPLIQLWRRDLNPDRHNSLRAIEGPFRACHRSGSTFCGRHRCGWTSLSRAQLCARHRRRVRYEEGSCLHCRSHSDHSVLHQWSAADHDSFEVGADCAPRRDLRVVRKLDPARW